MAYFDDTDERFEPEPRAAAALPQGAARGGLSALMNWAGALVSLGLVAGMGVWAFQLTMRDVSGVPVIEALEGPMRQPPADPGGIEAPHQGLAVNRIAEGAEAAPVPDQLVIAPPPLDLRPVEQRPLPLDGTDPAPGAAEAAPDGQAEADPEDAAVDTASLIERLLREAHMTGVDEPAPAGAPPEVTRAA
ncbi:MAG: SPOR domain-containing protein, partial [Roseicyclus sp.]